jgi:hypothetical protein
MELSRTLKMPELMYAVMATDLKMVNEIFDFVGEIEFLDPDMLNTFIRLVTPNEIIPNLDTLFQKAKEFNAAFGGDGSFMVKLPNLPPLVIEEFADQEDMFADIENSIEPVLVNPHYVEAYGLNIVEDGVEVDI